MLRRAKSVDIPFMVKGYEIGLRDGNFSESKMQINAFFANTTTHKNVHSYIYDYNGASTGYAILRKKDDGRHEIMMMFVDPAQQGHGIGRKFLNDMLAGPLKDSPVLCSTTQPASTRMMKLLKGLGFERKAEAVDGVYWEKRNTPGAKPAGAAAPKASAPPPTGQAPTRLLLPMSALLDVGENAREIEQTTQVSPQLPTPYAPPPEAPPPTLEGHAVTVAEEPPPPPVSPAPETVAEPPPEPSAPVPQAPPPPAAVPQFIEHPADEGEAEEEADTDETEPPSLPAIVPPEGSEPRKTSSLPVPPVDFSAKARDLGYASKRERAQQLAQELFQTLRGDDSATEAATPPSLPTPAAAPDATEPDMEDIPLLATLSIVREKIGTLPSVSLPPLTRYELMEFNKKDLENMNIVELAALSAQLIRLAKDQLAELDRLKAKPKKRR